MKKIKKPLVSVRLMVYNNESYIKEAIEGVLMQRTNFEVEVVVGDDFSTDETLQIIKSFEDTDNIHFKILERPKGGKYWYKRNKKNASVRTNFIDIIENCEGKYIALLDGDDYWTDELKLQKQIDLLESNTNYVLSCHNSSVINDEGEYVRVFNPDRIPASTDTAYVLENEWYIPTATAVFRNDLKLPKWFSKVQNGDYSLYLILTAGGGSIHYDNELRSAYRIHDQSVSSVFAKSNVYNFSMIYINQKFNKYSKYRYKDICYSQIEKNALIILKNTKLSSKTFWVLIWKLVGPNRGMTKKIKEYLFNRIKASKLMKIFRL